MNTPNTPRESQSSPDKDAKVLAWMKLKREMEVLHSQVEYVRLMLKLGVGQR